MDRFRQKVKKDKPMKYVEMEKSSSSFITDVKAIKENLKIKEILKTVKMSSSMRIKAPKGSKVMQNKDFSENEDIFDGDTNSEDTQPPSATNPNVLLKNNCLEEKYLPRGKAESADVTDINKQETIQTITNAIDDHVSSTIHGSNSLPDLVCDKDIEKQKPVDNIVNLKDISTNLTTNNVSQIKARDRKLSLDQTMLSRREGLSQSELDLNSIGKSPLERKSSFFRKKMDSFLKNTTEIFKRQSIGRNQSMQRRGSMSVSLQSLNENAACNGNYVVEALQKHQEERQGSMISLQSSAAPSSSSLSGRSPSERTLPDPHSEGESLAGSRPVLTASQPLGDLSSNSVHSLNEAYIQESLLNSRAISMSSGLDSAHGQSRRKASRTNRVTWLASEGLTNYLRRVIQDEKSREIQGCHSFQDFSTIPESYSYDSKTDSKGRRLSYQRAVSGEDPRHYESKKRQLIPEYFEANYDIADKLDEYTQNGLPGIQGYSTARITDEAYAYLVWAENPENLEEFYDWKKLTPNEESRQAVIRELITTEADYIRHLLALVEVFIATAHALQDAGKLLDVDTERLFSNIPDVLNASLFFWETTIYPMIQDAADRNSPFNTELMSSGFCRFSDMFAPLEKYVNEQTKALDYLRSLSNNADFMAYLTWCHGQRACNRLQLSDIMAKPMQRLTKYSLILRRIYNHTDVEPERTSLRAMETFAKNYVLDLNRSIRQREELEKLDQLAATIEAYDIDFRDEELDRHFRMYSQLNLRAPMINCPVGHSRCLIHEGDLRYKDKEKEMEVRIFLLTDMMLICKKNSKGSLYPYKVIRPKYMIDKIVTNLRYSTRNPKELQSIVIVVLDEVGSSYQAFMLTESSRAESGSPGTLRLWEQKLREARLTYDLAVWFARNPSRDLSEIEMDSSSEYAASIPSTSKPGVKQTSDDINIEREARERVAAMLHRSIEASTDCDFSQASMTTDSFDGEPSTSGGRPCLHSGLRYPMKRNSTGGSSRNSRLSSFQQSTSAASHDEPQPGPSRYNYRPGTSVEHIIPSVSTEDGPSPCITVNVVSESETETLVHSHQQPPTLVLQQPSPHKTPSQSRSPSCSRNTLRVQPQNVVMALVHSLPDLTMDPALHHQPQRQSQSPQSASEKLYQSHQELLQRNRLSAMQQQHYLTPNHRGTSYPPPSPTRASLKRGLAFSYSFKNPPLAKMGHVNSQSQVQAEAGPSTSHGARPKEKSKSPEPGPSKSKDKPEKKSKNVSSRNKGGSTSPSVRKEDKEEKGDKRGKSSPSPSARKEDKEENRDIKEKGSPGPSARKEDKEEKGDNREKSLPGPSGRKEEKGKKGDKKGKGSPSPSARKDDKVEKEDIEEKGSTSTSARKEDKGEKKDKGEKGNKTD